MVILQPASDSDSKWICVDFMDLGVFWGENVFRPVRTDYTGVVALKKPCNLGTSILMSEPAGMESGSVDGDSALCSRQAWRLAAWMVILQPASDSDSKWICVDFILMTEPGSLQAWRLAAWMVILHPAAGTHGGWQLGW